MDVSAAVRVLTGSRRILVFTGAGISVESGIPDFRGPDGLWSIVDPSVFWIDRYLSDAEARRQVWKVHAERGLSFDQVGPNPAHLAIVDLWKAHRMSGCVTQNIDGLHQAAGLPDEAVAELHGNLRRVRCLSCGAVLRLETVLERVRSGDTDPHCEACGGILKADTVLFGEVLPPVQIARAQQMADAADAVLAVGSTLSVYPAADYALEPVRRGAPLVIANLGPTDQDRWATVRLEGRAGEIVPALVEALLSERP